MSTFTPGKYRIRLNRAALGKSKEKGTPCADFFFDPLGMVDPTRPDELVACPAYECKVTRYITANTIDYLVADLQKLGYDRDTFDQIDSNHPQAFPWSGLECSATCRDEEYDGKTFSRWNFDWGAYSASAIDNSEVSKLNALFGKALKGLKQQRAAQLAAVPATGNVVPF